MSRIHKGLVIALLVLMASPTVMAGNFYNPKGPPKVPPKLDIKLKDTKPKAPCYLPEGCSKKTTQMSDGVDTDKDGVSDAQDNCPVVANADQVDSDKNGIGDACECGAGKVMAWASFNQGLPAEPISVNAFVTHHDILFAGTSGNEVYSSKDGGATWQATGLLPASFSGNYIITELATDGKVLYAGTFGGVYQSKDDGANWEVISEGLPFMVPDNPFMGLVPIHGMIAYGKSVYAGAGDLSP